MAPDVMIADATNPEVPLVGSPYDLRVSLGERVSEADIRKLAGGNVLRVMRRVEAVAAGKKDERPNLARLPEAAAPE